MKMKIYYLLTGLLLLSLHSCRPVSETEKEMKRFLGSKVDLPEELVQQISGASSNYHLVIYLEAADCVPCSLSKLTILNQYAEDFEKFNTDIVLVIDESENKKQIEESFTGMKIEYLFFFDKDNYLLKNNPIISTNLLCRTFIIDKNMEVIWIGSPIANAKSIEGYRRMMEVIMQ
ncbi:MAG: redoxin domain-containing protein [Tannerella sp.]|jgi:alkyl hydroperoxide reductase subunit AhpC|nr:redoxin domain-containing protein [Tannerella sp.]